MVIHGIANIAKPRGPTSHDVVARVRRAVGQRKVGHAGTLDPRAEGVLIILLGRASRLSDHIMGSNKTYRFSVAFGIETDSLDLDGEVTSAAPVDGATEAALHAACAELVGAISMLPPLYSAVRHEGRKLYELARQGEQVAPRPRTTTVQSLELLSANLAAAPYPLAEFRVTCSKGTYVRSLAREIARACGTVGSVDRLVRERSGAFTLEGAVPLEEFEARAAEGDAQSMLLPLLAAVPDLPRLNCEAAALERLVHGNAIVATDQSLGPEVAVCGPSGDLAALARVEQDGEAVVLRPRKVFMEPSELVGS